MVCDAARREWYTQRSMLLASTQVALHTNPDDPLDTCNRVLLDHLNAALVAPSHQLVSSARLKRARTTGNEDVDEVDGHVGVRAGRRFHRGTSKAQTNGHNTGTAKIAHQVEEEANAVRAILGAVVLAPTAVNHHASATGASSAPPASRSAGVESLFDASPLSHLSPCFGLEGDELRLVAAHTKRVDRLEQHRSMSTAALGVATAVEPLTETALMQREMKAAMEVRKSFSRARKS